MPGRVLDAAALRAVRIACVGLAIALTVNLFHLGAGPGAVGLFAPPWDKVAHFTVFAILTTLLAVGIGLHRPWITLAVVAMIGLGDELHQVYLPGRSAGIDDWFIDAAAGVCVVVAISVMRKLAVRESNAGATAR